MTHEQKQESAEFRTREAHRRSFAQAWQDEGMGQLYAEALADAELSEAEARGAAEQRRKDAEGSEPVGYVRQDMMEFFRQSKALFTSASIIPKRDETHTEALYTRPANVTALEDRVKELEGEVERLKKPEFYSFEDHENGWFDLDALMDSIEDDVTPFEPFEVNCFRSVPKIWAFCDGSKVHEFATEDEARAASAAAIREGGEHG